MAPVDPSPTQSRDVGNFKLITSLTMNNVVPVHQYKSTKTGLTVAVAEVEGPVVNGYFCVATEAHDDDGLPHTLEHLVFLGSENYPYKGVLDLLANRCLASGTNAWTDTDHTCYTMSTAGSEGFLSLMPIYLDHVLYPLLTDSGFITEVYHIDGEGRDGGVVYTEMQGKENCGESRVTLELLRSVYPGDCGYKYETGGIMKNLRESTSNEKIRKYHKEFYRPENLCVIVVGHVKPEEVLRALGPLEDKIIGKGPRGDYVRPWQTPVPPLTQHVDREVLYPCDDESNGMVYVAWRGPSLVTDCYKVKACSILLKYLTDTSVSPLPKEFVEIADPFASKVSYSLVQNSESLLMIQFDNVPVEKLSLVRDKLTEVFNNLVNQSEPLDMKRLKTVINRHRLESLTHLENSPHDSVAFVFIEYMLYGNSNHDLQQRLNLVAELEKMENEDTPFWLDLFKTYLINGFSVTIRGRPSKAEQTKIAKDVEDRVAQRVKEFGSEGLRVKEQIVISASEKNDVPPPEKVLTSVPVPGIDSIHFYPINALTSFSKKQHPSFNVDDVPIYVQLDDLNTNFVYMFVLMDSSTLPSNLRPYIILLLECILESPIERDGQLIPYESVIAQLEEDTIAAATKIGLESSLRFHCGPFSYTLSLMLQLEPKKYENGINWLRELLYQTKITEERVKIIATKMLNCVAETKRKGSSMVYDLMKGMLYNKESNHYVVSVLRQQKFLTEVMDRFNKGSGESVLKDLENLRNFITQPDKMAVHLAANLESLRKLYPNVAAPWKNLLPENLIPAKNKLHVVPDWTLLRDAKDLQSCVTGIGSVESNFLCHTSPCLNDFMHQDLAPLLVYLQYLTQLEGPMWKQIRGQGLAYNYNIVPRPHESLLYLTLYRAGNVIGAYKESRNVIEGKLKSKSWDLTLFESAKSSLIFEIIDREKSIGDVVAQSLLSYFKGVDHNYNKDLVKRISEVKISDLEPIGPKYIFPMFNESLAKTSVVCHPSKIKEVADGLNELGLNLTVYSSLDESFLSTW